MKQTINTTGDLSNDGKTIILKEAVKNIPAGKVHLVIITEDDEISDDDWLSALGNSNLYDDLKHEDEDIYSVKDGSAYYGSK